METHHIPIIASSDTKNGATAVSTGGDAFTTEFKSPIVGPKDAVSCYITLMKASIQNSALNITTANNVLNLERKATATIEIKLDPGLYSLGLLNAAVNRILMNAGLANNAVVISGDVATQKVVFTLSTDLALQMIATSPYALLGCAVDSRFPATAATFATATTSYLAPNVAKLNSITSFLVHTDLVRQGVNLYNYTNILDQVLINVSPNRTIAYNPTQPIEIPADHLIGTQIERARFWLTNQDNGLVDLNGEKWSCLVRLTYVHPVRTK